jgi:hypothetical protein
MSLRNLYLFLTSLGLLVLVYFLALSEVPVDSGDGLSHYFIVKQVWQEPIYLLDHWGKPLFTFFAAPFAYFGFHGYVAFNLLLYTGTCLIAYQLGSKMNSPGCWILLFPIGLLTSADYASNVVGGMTEVFFGFMIVLAAWFLVTKRWFWFALVVSFAPFARSEGQLLVVFAVPILFLFKAYKYLPVLAFGFFLYALVGWWALDDFWWYFNRNPYQNASAIYGSGTWMHYIEHWPVHLGILGLCGLFVALITALIKGQSLRFNSIQRATFLFLLFSYSGILLTHMYLWENGKNGALGLTRLAIHGWPGFLLCMLLILENLNLSTRIQKGLIGITVLGSFGLIYDYPWVYDQVLPKLASADERAVLQAADFIENQNIPYQKLYYTHPLFAWKMGTSIKDKKSSIQQFSSETSRVIFETQKETTLFVVDSHFGPESDFPLEHLEDFEVLQTFTPLNQMVHREESIAQVLLLKTGRNEESNPTLDTVNAADIKIMSDSLYSGFLTMPKSTLESQLFDLHIRRQDENSEGHLYFVIQGAETGDAIRFNLAQEGRWIFSLSEMGSQELKFFIHNPNQLTSELKISLMSKKKPPQSEKAFQH